MIGCLLVNRFPLACELAAHPELIDRRVVVTRGNPPPVVWAASWTAERGGVSAGMGLREANSLCPDLIVIAGRPAQYRSIADGIIERLGRLLPAIDPSGEGEVYLSLDGLSLLHPNDSALHAGLLATVPDALEPRLGIGPGRFVALVAARRAAAGQAVVAPADNVAGFLAGEPITSLPIDPEVIRRLLLLGLTCLGDVARLPRDVLVAGLGPVGAVIWHHSRGNVDQPVAVDAQADLVEERHDLEDAVESRATLLALLDQMLSHLCGHPRFRDRSTRRIVLRLVSERGEEWERTLILKEATSRPGPIWDVLRPAVDAAALPAPVVQIQLRLDALLPARGWQGDLDFDRRGRDERLDDGIKKLTVQFGRCPVARYLEVDQWNRVPERRTTLIDYRSPTNR